MTQAVAEQQTALLDINGREFNQLWVDDNAPLFVANNPLHWKAHKIQVALARLDKIAEKNPAQFNSTAYFAALDKLAELMEQINSGQTKVATNDAENDAAILESGEMDQGSAESGGSEAVRPGESDGLDSGISADNPFARQGLPPA